MGQNKKKLSGVFAPVVTPFHADEPALDDLRYNLKKLNDTDQTGYLAGDLLIKTDYATMAHGLEARAPLLDHRLAAVAGTLPNSLKASSTETKIALRRLAARALPADLVQRPKRGFGLPLRHWFRQDLATWARKTLLDQSSTAGTLFEPGTIRRVLEEHREGRRNHAKRIYSLLMFELWYRRYGA